MVEAIRQAIIKQSTSIRYVEKVLKSNTEKIGRKPPVDFEGNLENEIVDDQISINDFLTKCNQSEEKKPKWMFWNKK